MKIRYFSFLTILIFCLFGCSAEEIKVENKVKVPEYEKQLYNTINVSVGDLTPEITLKLDAPNYRLVRYAPMYDEMEVEKVFVSKGEHVKKGDKLVSFKSGDINDQIREYEKMLEEHTLMLEHYTNLKEMAKKVDATKEKEKDKNADRYDVDIQQINESIVLDNLYIQELKAKLESYSICAEEAGTVYDVTEGIESAIVNTDKSIVAVVYGNECFSAEFEEDFDLEKGQTYLGIDGVDEYDMVLTSIETKTNDQGLEVKELSFKPPKGLDFGYADDMTLTISRPTLKNVMYIPTSCIKQLNDKKFVYTLDEKGYRWVSFVECGQEITIENGPEILKVTVILSGLKESDQVVSE